MKRIESNRIVLRSGIGCSKRSNTEADKKLQRFILENNEQ